MDKALVMAHEALNAGEVPIGCVIIDANTGTILSRGRNRTNETRNATRHAEFDALTSLFASLPKSLTNDKVKLWDYTSQSQLFVTVEPCIMCAAALRQVGLVQVYFGCYNERFGGCGSILPAHQDYISSELDPPLTCTLVKEYRKECIELLRHFYLRENERAPIPKKKVGRTFKPVSE